ncbi:NADH-cytochrome b5 reductase 1-like, partial [Ylistrum balloti]|uniref:NADH-cytochrome b5 reductase 1-like n=1 Tax=Ylistrum balloti TaxID=509963 RepID=UPI002905D417
YSVFEGEFKIRPDEKTEASTYTAKKVGMIAGGTGITPMYQLIKQVFKDPKDKTELFLLFANQIKADTGYGGFCDKGSTTRSNANENVFSWSAPTEVTGGLQGHRCWTYSKGFVSADMIRDHLPGPEEGTMILMCGPPPMINFACIPNLENLGYPPEMRFAY